MTKHELTFKANYVATWTLADAIRELLQNALDEEKRTPDNFKSIEYDAVLNILTISNKLSKLTVDTLLLGSTSKADNNKYIGQHGEGYKLATIILLRNDCKITFFNYNCREIWTTALEESKKYNGAELPVFYITKMKHKDNPLAEGLHVQIEGITPDVYREVVTRTLFLDPEYDAVDKRVTNEGTVILDKGYKGKVYVSGLYVCTNKSLEYGYDLRPGSVKLDRDRRLVADFDLHWETSKIIAATQDADLIKRTSSSNDSRYITNVWSTYVGSSGSSEADVIRTAVLEDFQEKHGAKAVAVSTTADFNKLRDAGQDAVLVSEQIFSVLSTVPDMQKSLINAMTELSTQDSVYKDLSDLYEDVKYSLNTRQKTRFEVLLARVKVLVECLEGKEVPESPETVVRRLLETETRFEATEDAIEYLVAATEQQMSFSYQDMTIEGCAKQAIKDYIDEFVGGNN